MRESKSHFIQEGEEDKGDWGEGFCESADERGREVLEEMSVELILGGIGAALGIANFVYWAWLARRERVVIVNPEVYTYFLPKGVQRVLEDKKPDGINNHALQIGVVCALALTNGEKEIEVNEVDFKLEKDVYKRLKEYFPTPFQRYHESDPSYVLSFHLSTYAINKEDRHLGASLQPKKSVDFTGVYFLESTQKFDNEYETLGIAPYPDGSEPEEFIESPEFVKPILEELRTNYQICWTRYDGKELCWRFPNRWWRNLGKKLWG